MSLNKVILSGRLGRKPMLREFPNGGCVANFSLAVDRYKGSGDSRTKLTDWYNCVVRERKAQFFCEAVMQGQSVVIIGRLVTNTFKRDGTEEEVRVVEIEVDEVELGQLPKASSETPA